MLTTLAVANYRSLRSLVLELGRLNVVTGPNGSGKSSVYRALRLLAQTAQGRVIAALAREGGFQSTLWAGPEDITRSMRAGEQPIQGTRRKNPVTLKLGFAGEDLGYCIDLGLPIPRDSAFARDPEIKGESIWAGPMLRPAATLVERENAVVRIRRERDWEVATHSLATFDSMLTQLADPKRAPEILAVREQVRAWRFYDHFRTDVDAPARTPQLGTYTPVLSDDGADFAAAWQTIVEIGDHEALREAVADAFEGGSVEVNVSDGRFELFMRQHGLLRPLRAAELSDGTLRYLLWIVALLSPRPPELLVLNEPETSLHPDLLPALGRLIIRAAERSQIIVVSHSTRLVAALAEHEDCREFGLEKETGETRLRGVGRFETPAWRWSTR